MQFEKFLSKKNFWGAKETRAVELVVMTMSGHTGLGHLQ